MIKQKCRNCLYFEGSRNSKSGWCCFLGKYVTAKERNCRQLWKYYKIKL